MGRSSHGPLFATESIEGRTAYRLFAASMLAGICLVLFYRAANIPGGDGGDGGGGDGGGGGGQGRWAWIGMLGAELWFGFYWVVTQSVRWNPIRRSTFKDRLATLGEAELPSVDIFVCTADPVAEPPALVISTVLSVMAYDYPPEKLNVYLSDDGGSQLTFYALWEAAEFAKQWVPYCKRHGVEPRSPAAYFASRSAPHGTCIDKERLHMKNLYEEMLRRIEAVAMVRKIPEDIKAHKGFSEWNSGTTSKNHHAIVQILLDNKDKSSIDNDGSVLPMLVYMAREKRPHHHHNFKAGAMNALLRASSVIGNSPIILNVDCDMYSNNASSIRDALCFFLDEEKGHDIAFVQFPQNFENIGKHDIYGNACKVINNIELPGLDYWGGPAYIGTGCFHRRETLRGRNFTKDYKEDWIRGTKRDEKETAFILEDRAKSLIACTYELNTPWGHEMGLKYGCAVEDVITGLAIHCRGWKSVYFNPTRKGFLGVAPMTLEQTLVLHRRLSEGNFQIFLSKYCPFLYGHGRINLGHQMSYSIYGLWAPNSFPTLYYVTVPCLCLLRGISLFPKVSSLWFIPFAYVIVAKNIYSLTESLACGDTLVGWWNAQRMWLLKRITSYLYGTTDAILKVLGISNETFAITAKVADAEACTRFEQEVIEFRSQSPMFVVIATIALLNFAGVLVGLHKVAAAGWGFSSLDQLFIQIVLCGVVAALNLPFYGALFLRNEKDRMASSVALTSLALTLLAFLLVLLR